ncbi:MAG: glucuronate isomerase [Eubacteriales bacterium]
MEERYLIHSESGRSLYREVKDLPICDYHCHLSPKEIYEDKPFDSIGRIWLSGDHYKWRLMRMNGADESLITGDADWNAKFDAYASAVELAAGNPLYHWTAMELDRYFDIHEPLTAENAARIRQTADQRIAEKRLSPRKLILSSNVRYIATTDEICDDLSWHEKLAADSSFPVKVAPSFRTDRLLSILAADYPDYLKKLEAASGMTVSTLDDLKAAVCQRLDFFVAHGCKFTDVGIPCFPLNLRDEDAAEEAFRQAKSGDEISEIGFFAFLDHMMRFLGVEYAKRGLVMQLHLAVSRNVNSKLYRQCGPDAGGDCAGDVIPVSNLIAFLDAIHTESPVGLPETVIYCLNPAMIPAAASVAGSFPKVRMGAAWWFCDHKRGIREQIETIAEYTHLGKFLGMLTDSRSFLSYARHDYFRRILCDLLGEWVDGGELTFAAAEKTVKAICYTNAAELVGLTADPESLSYT